jgi:hypothetical protein
MNQKGRAARQLKIRVGRELKFMFQVEESGSSDAGGPILKFQLYP